MEYFNGIFQWKCSIIKTLLLNPKPKFISWLQWCKRLGPKVLLQSTNLDDKYFILLLQVYFSNEYFPALFLPEFTESFWQAEEKYAGILIFRRRRARVVVTFRTNLLFAFWETYVLKAGRTETVPETPIYIHMSKSDIRKLPEEIARIFFLYEPFFWQFRFLNVL